MKTIHCFQHEPFEGLGQIENWLKSKEYRVSYTYFFKPHSLPSIQDMDGLIVMGGAMSINDEETFTWLKAEKAFIQEFLQSGKPVLGICLGSQLLANVLGSRVYQNEEKEIGWLPIHFHRSETVRRLFGDRINDPTVVFHWHGETFDLPAKSECLFFSEACKNQAFLWGKNALGLQFHLEATPTGIDAMLEGAGTELTEGLYIQSEAQIRNGIGYTNENHQLLYHILEYLF